MRVMQLAMGIQSELQNRVTQGMQQAMASTNEGAKRMDPEKLREAKEALDANRRLAEAAAAISPKIEELLKISQELMVLKS